MVKKGFEFTVMLVGESGLGKSTLVSSLFLLDKIYADRTIPSAADRCDKTVDICPIMCDIEERGVRLKLTIVDTPGFGDSLHGDDQTGPIIDYVDRQFQQYLDDESGLNRRNISDTRVHCCIYFVAPHSNGLKPIDIEFMKSLHHKVNIIPVIAKSDTLTLSEIKAKKLKIQQDLETNQIRIYNLPQADVDEEEGYRKQLEQLRKAVPFAIVGSTDTYEVKGKQVRGRLYPWGVVEIENPLHSDFILLREMLMCHMQDLQEVTHDVHYESFRASILTQTPNQSYGTLPGKDRISMSNMSQIASQELEEKEAEILRMREMMRQMELQLKAVKKPAPPVPHRNSSADQEVNL